MNAPPVRSALLWRLIFAAVWMGAAAPQAPAAPVIVETDPLTPEEQRARFHLPPGFEIQLVAAEPDVVQPMNLGFDAAGRLWVTQSWEYPFPAQGPGVQPRDMREDRITEGPPRDRLTIIESLRPDGRAASLRHVLTGLNIPIGQLPVAVAPDGPTTAVVYSIPHIGRYVLAPGAPERNAANLAANDMTPLFAGWGNVDTHGMCSSFTRGLDGWVYGCHGFRNTSRVPRPGAEPLVLNSGNTYRFTLDGARLESFSFGQVNPFGMACDAWGDLYNADCHSLPLTLLLRGAYYESFGKPHDGLGFGPPIIDHNHGSTGICGVAWCESPAMPPEFQENAFICNPVNGQVHRDRLEWSGSSPHVVTLPDLLTCDDQWFRPVDVKLGPDGALYVADFYNAIIGHYEAPLQHPRRDRTKGRIWRIVYTGTHAAPTTARDLTRLPDRELIPILGDPNITVRMLAANLLVDRHGGLRGLPKDQHADSDDALRRTTCELLKAEMAASAERRGAEESGALLRASAAWVLHRLTAGAGPTMPVLLGDARVAESLARDPAAVVRTHLARICGDAPRGCADADRLLALLIRDSDARVRRAAADSLAQRPQPANAPLLLEALTACGPGDPQLRHALRLAVREQFRTLEGDAEVLSALSPEARMAAADIAIAVRPSPPGLANWLQTVVVAHAPPAPGLVDRWRGWLQGAAESPHDDRVRELMVLARETAGGDPQEHVARIRAAVLGRRAAGLPAPPELRDWGARLVLQLLAESQNSSGWTARPLQSAPGGAALSTTPVDDVFVSQSRPSADGDSQAEFLNSLPRGEQRTGRLVSAPFAAPPRLSFWIAGHNDVPDRPDSGRNAVQLLDADTGRVLRRALPPRNDLAQRVDWELNDVSGRRVLVEIVDGDDRDAYAWLAVGRFSYAPLNPRGASPGAQAVELVRDLRLEELRPRLEALLLAEGASARKWAAEALLALAPDARLAVIAFRAGDPELPEPQRARLYAAIGRRDGDAVQSALREVVQLATGPQQQQVAAVLSGDPAGGEALLALCGSGVLSPRLLQDPGTLQRLHALALPDLSARTAALTSGLPPADEQLAQRIAERRAAWDAAAGDSHRGREVFAKRCAACHQLGGTGHKIGPQLDGLGVRGVDRLLEDILDPNRNVDAAFRTTTLALADGRVITGLLRSEQGSDLVLADQEGKEVRVSKTDVEEQRTTNLSLMPANWGDQLPPQELLDVLAWVLESRSAGQPAP